jgi:hypothetical protein
MAGFWLVQHLQQKSPHRQESSNWGSCSGKGINSDEVQLEFNTQSCTESKPLIK